MFYANQIVVINELVAVVDKQVGGRFLHANADDRLGVLAELAHERREIRIAADDDERVDVALRVTKIERVDYHPDVGRIFPGLANVRDLDQLEGGFVQPALECLVAVEIAVGFLHHDVALEKQTLDHFANVERRKLRFMRAYRDILQTEKDRHCRVGFGRAHRRILARPGGTAIV